MDALKSKIHFRLQHGSPGLYGNSAATLYFDNVQVIPKSK